MCSSDLGGRLGENLLALGHLTPEHLEQALGIIPPVPRNLDETSIDLLALLDLAAKAMHSGSIDTATKLADLLKLPTRLGIELMRAAEQRQLVETQGLAGVVSNAELRYSLTAKGRQWAQNAFDQNSYVGPVPVTLDDYVERIRRQRIAGERVPPDAVRTAMSDLTMSEIGRAHV